MIDYILKFASEAAAKTALASRFNKDENGDLQWPTSHCLPGLTVWRDSQDVHGVDADGNPTVTYAYLTGFFILVSLDQVLPALRDAAAVHVVVDRDKAVACDKTAVIKSNVSVAMLKDLRWSPVFAGSDNPWGTWD